MRILMEQGGHAFRNVGDWAMLRVAVNRLRTLFPGCQISLLGDDAARIAECMPEVQPLTTEARGQTTGAGCLLGRWSGHAGEIDRKLMWSKPGWLLPLVRLRRGGRPGVSEFMEAVKQADLVIASGGGYITDAFPEMVAGVCGVLAVAQRLGKPTAMLGQGLGPLHDGKLRTLARAGMANLELITVRESLKSPAVAAGLGLAHDRITVTGDDAVELAYGLRPARMGTKIGLNVRATDYSAVAPSDLQRLRVAVSRIMTDLAAAPQLLPISLYNHEDVVSTGALLDPETFAPPIVRGPEDVIELAGECRVVITGSYHAAVFALAQGIPVVALVKSAYYRDKFTGLAGPFGEGCVCLDMSDRDFPEKLHAIALRLHGAAERWRPALLERAEAQIADGRNAYHRLPEMLCAA